MNVCSLEWLVAFLALSTLFFLAPGVRLRQVLFAACNAGFVATMVPNAAGWIALAAFIGFGFLAATLLRRFPRKSILVLYLAVVLSAFVFLKQYSFIRLILPETFFRRTIATVGWSYILFRQIQVAVDALQGQIENLSLWSYLNFQLNVFGFVAGPIQRYEEFCRYWTACAPILGDAESILRAYLRIFTGVVKITLFGAFFLARYRECSDVLTDDLRAGQETFGRRLLQLVMLYYSYPPYLYFNFSGYCDMVIGGAALFGLKMPENFDRPYLSRNMIDFWTRFHRTLGFWIRDYIFTPMYKALAVRWPKSGTTVACFCYFAAFFLAGTWHGSTWNFVVFGFLNGLGLAAAKLWETWQVKRAGRAGLRTYLQNPIIRLAAIIATVHYAGLTQLFFAAKLPTLSHIVENVFASRLSY